MGRAAPGGAERGRAFGAAGGAAPLAAGRFPVDDRRMTTMRARSAGLAAAAALAVLLPAVLVPATTASAAALAAAPADAPRLTACNEVGSRQPGDFLIQTRLEASGRFIGSYPGYTITKVEGATLLATPLCITVTDGGPGTDHVSVTMAAAVGRITVHAKRATA